MANQKHIDILMQGVSVWNKWRKRHPLVQLDFSQAHFHKPINLNGADLRGANFNRAFFHEDIDLSGADLRGADLSRAFLVEQDLRAANLSQAKLFNTCLTDSDLKNANLTRSDLRMVQLNGANIRVVNFTGADLRSANLSGADIRKANFSEANLIGADLSGANISETNLSKANLSRCYIYAISAWDINLQDTVQRELKIASNLTVDNLEMAQFIYLLLNHKKLRDVLNTVTEKGVLLLGRFSDGGLELLQAIASELREMKYLPMIFDFDRPDNRDLTETVKTLVGLSRFVIVDLSGPSVPQELYATAPHFDIPFVTIIEAGRKPHSMFRDLLKYPWVFSPVEFNSKDHLIGLLSQRVIKPAEEKCKERQALLQQLFQR